MTIAERSEHSELASSNADARLRVVPAAVEGPKGIGEPRAPSRPGPTWGRTSRADVRAQAWVQITLALVIGALILYLMSVPRPRASRVLLSQEREFVELRLALEELRAVIADYRADHGLFPGRGPNGSTDASWFERQLVLATNKAGEAAAERIQTHPLGPYAPQGVPLNPVNGLSTVRFLGADVPWPEDADGRTGWLYRPSTGDIRANCQGVAIVSGQRYYDL